MRTIVYIDGFNLYHRSLKKTPYKWLDLKALCAALLKPPHEIIGIKYYTALVNAKDDPQRPIRQKSYIRALEHLIPGFSVYYGKFLQHEISAKLVSPINGQKYVKVYKTEEKGSDVNLAVHLLNDAWLDAYDCAVVLSNDSDLAESIRIVRHQLNKKVGVLIPNNSFPSRQLIAESNFQKHIRPQLLANCQMPSPIPGTNIHKPATW